MSFEQDAPLSRSEIVGLYLKQDARSSRSEIVGLDLK